MSSKTSMLTTTQLDRKLQKELSPGFLYRLYKNIDPTNPLGPKATQEIDNSYIKISLLFVSFFILSVMSTVLYTLVKDDSYESPLAVALLSLSWFIFVSFCFLIFESTRLLNILILISILGLCANILDRREINKKNDASYVISIIILAITSITLSILIIYFASSSGNEELIQLKTRAREEERRRKLAEMIKGKLKETEDSVREKLKAEMQSEEGVRRVIANAALEGLVDNAKKGFKAPQPKKKSKKKEDNKKEDEE